MSTTYLPKPAAEMLLEAQEKMQATGAKYFAARNEFDKLVDFARKALRVSDSSKLVGEDDGNFGFVQVAASFVEEVDNLR